MAEKKISVNPVNFPGEYVTDKQKATKEFGLRIGQAIQNEWFKKDKGNSRFYSQWDSFHKLRLYARGEQSISKYKNELGNDGDLSYINIDWTPVPVIPKFIDIVVNGMADRMYKVKAYAQDSMSAEKRNAYQDNLETDMISKDLLKQVQQDFGVNGFNTNPDELPADDEELALHMQLKYKPSIEIAEEAVIKTTLSENKFEDARKRIAYDMATIGIGIGKQEFLPGDGIKVNYVDPANTVYSYTEDPNFKDCFYWGEVKTVHKGELRKINPNLTDDQLKDISALSSGWIDYNNASQYYKNTLFNNDTVTLLYFNYKCDRKFKYKKKFLQDGTEKVIAKPDSFNPPAEMLEEGRFEVIEKTIDVWYEGVLVLGTDYILKWEMSENMVRPKSASQRAVANYVACAPRMYKGNIESLLRRMIPFADLINMTHYKLQQVQNRIVPDGVFIDADGINEVDLGDGGEYTPEDALNLYFQTGSVVGRSYTGDGEFNNARVPIQELASSSGQSKIASLINSYNHYLNMIRDVTGLNEARDGSMPDANSLVGLQKLAAANSNTATKHILEGVIDITRDLAEAISCRISDVLEYSEHREDFIMKVGKYNVNLLRDIKDLHLHDFGIFIEVAPDEEEKQQLEANIQVALSKGGIDLDDAIDVREVKNIKLANQLLKVKRKRKQEREQQMKAQEQQQQAQINMQSQQMAAQTAMQKIEAESNSKIRIAQANAGFEIEKMKAEAEQKKELMNLEFQMQMQLKGADIELQLDKENLKEDRKDNRTKLQATQQSKMVEQRHNKGAAINFESNEDSLDGFDLAEFEPR